MSHSLPPLASPLRDLFEVSDLVAISTGERPVPVFGHGLRNARRTVRENKAVNAVFFFAVESATDELGLYRVGKRGGHKRLWVFGPITRATRLA